MFRFTFLAVAAFALFAGSGSAAESPAKPDLAELREAITAADKRGENVSSIREAFGAFEKSLAKGFAAPKPGEATPTPPELTALRDAVEMAAKKGENVEAIAKELAVIEKAITGREYERPKPPAPEPVRPIPPRRGGGFVIGGNGRVVIGGGGFNSTSVVISGGTFTIKARQGNVSYTVTGTADATISPTVTIVDGEKKIETDDPKKIPEEHRGAVERLLKMIGR